MSEFNNPILRHPATGPGLSERAASADSRAHARAVRRRSPRVSLLGVLAVVVVGGVMGATPASAADASVLGAIKACESGGSYTVVNPSSGASGAYQFLNSTWGTVPASAGYRTAASAPPAVQDLAAQQLFAREGTRPWVSSAACWQRGGSVVSRSTTRAPQPNLAAAPAPVAGNGHQSVAGNGDPSTHGQDEGNATRHGLANRSSGRETLSQDTQQEGEH